MQTEETLDPQDWNSMCELGHRMIDDMFEYLRTVRDRPVWEPMPIGVKKRLAVALPLKPEGAAKTYQDFLETVLPYPLGNIHPSFWAWVMGTGTPFGALAEMLAATMNSNVPGGDHSAAYVEHQVLDWCKEMVGYPRDSSGLLVAGCSMANFIDLTVARNTKAGYNVAKEGVSAAPKKLTFYGSVEIHSSLKKAVETLGLGLDALRLIPVDSNFEIDLQGLVAAISNDRSQGFLPCCVIGNAGTVNTGATDNLDALADICQAENLWLHVDGAFGALAMLSPQLRPILKGLDRVDSLAFDLHKWMYMQYEAGCIFIRHPQEHHKSFSTSGAYLARSERGPAGNQTWFSEYGLELSRGAKALKIWMSLKEHGVEKYGRIIQQNVDQARYLEALIKNHSELELLAPVALNVVCFRFTTPELDDRSLNELNREALADLQESGVAVPSGTMLRGRFAIRLAITNHRSRREDFDEFLNTFLEIAQSRAKAMQSDNACLTE